VAAVMLKPASAPASFDASAQYPEAKLAATDWNRLYIGLHKPVLSQEMALRFLTRLLQRHPSSRNILLSHDTSTITSLLSSARALSKLVPDTSSPAVGKRVRKDYDEMISRKKARVSFAEPLTETSNASPSTTSTDPHSTPSALLEYLLGIALSESHS